MKIVINTEFGGFSLSHKAVMHYAELKGIILYHWRDIARDDPDLIHTIEDLGDEANGDCAHLAIVEIPDGVEWGIEEYGGFEHVAEKHRTWYGE